MFCLKYFSFSRRAFQHPLNSVCILVVFEIFVFFFFIQNPFLSTKVILAITELEISNTNGNKSKTKQHDLVKNKS